MSRFVVGERGPELFIPPTAGRILPMAHRPERLFLGIPTWAWAIAVPAGLAIALIAVALVSGVLAIGGPA